MDNIQPPPIAGFGGIGRRIAVTFYMPEAPDVEVYRNALLKRLAGKRVTGAWTHTLKRTPPEAELRAAMVGATLVDIVRDGKKLRFVFDNDSVLVVHPMLNGEFYIGPEQDKLPAKRISLQFDEVGYLSISDFQGMATMQLNTPASKCLDALDPAFDLEQLKRALKKRATKTIKQTLMDQNVVQGIGNKYSDEILWLSKIAPESLSGKLPDDAVERLYAAIKSILTEACDRLVTMYPDKMNGKMYDGLKVYRQTATESGAPVSVIELGGRKAHYSPDEQVLYR